MKKIAALLFTIALYSSAQNPDGKNASLHLSPMWTWGSSDFSRATSVWYPPTQASPEQTVTTDEAGTLRHPLAFGFTTLMKIPTASFLTVSVGYSFHQHFEEFDNASTGTKYFSQYWKINGMSHSVNVTASVYNLFSVYQGD